jgi:hypothetical protein
MFRSRILANNEGNKQKGNVNGIFKKPSNTRIGAVQPEILRVLAAKDLAG